MWYYVLAIPVLLLTLWAQFNVQNTFTKYSKVASSKGLTGAMAAEQVLRANGVYDVTIERVDGHLTDHYDPKANTIRLSESVYDSRSIAAIGVASHEAGHAVQYAKKYFPIKIRTIIIPVTQIGSKLAMPIFLIGLLFTAFSFLTEIGILLFAASTVFQLVTLPVEFNASNRAIKTIRTAGLLEDGEIKYAKKTLSAAALTYVAALASSLLSLLRLVSIARGRRR